MIRKILASVAIVMIPVAYWLDWPNWVAYICSIVALVLIFLPAKTDK